MLLVTVMEPESLYMPPPAKLDVFLLNQQLASVGLPE
jgi:hypothetical protein